MHMAAPEHKLYDLTHNLDDNMSFYPGDVTYSAQSHLTVEKDFCNVSKLSLGSHTGTHLDAPFHFFPDGKRIHELDLNLLVGPAFVIDVRGKAERDTITWDDLSDHQDSLKKHRIVLIHTGWSQHWATNTYLNHPFLSQDAAQGIVDCGVRVLGIDTLSPDQTVVGDLGGDFSVHQIILGAGGVIAENICGLEQLPSATVNVSLLPLKLAGLDGSPVRAVAWV